MKKRYDILGLGCCTVDETLYVEAFPAPDSKVRVLERVRGCGGLTASALVAASRLGASCAYGAQLGNDENSQFVAQTLRHENVDLSPTIWSDAASPLHSTIIVDTTHNTRTIFWEKSGETGAHDELPSEETIRGCRVLFIDHYGTTGAIRAAKIARDAQIPVVADLERDNVPRFAELLALVDHLVISERFARHLSGENDAISALRVLVRGHETVVVTCGEKGAYFASRADENHNSREIFKEESATQTNSEKNAVFNAEFARNAKTISDDESAQKEQTVSDDETSRDSEIEVRHFPAFAVKTVDTTGCGDVFHGAYAAALAHGETLAARVRFASAAAAIKATRRGVQSGAPTREEVAEFLRQHC